ncbi:MAG: hypothetical protein H0X72_03355 [Acidobacteria bacterium]|jgi:ssDNA-binding Zn-finger/Zn-ribbon topoisomerase 1|nr:hypothetical protein [Acidobacteriota bacterium]
MNILNRLKKLESEVIGDSTFCDCNGTEQKVEFQKRTVEYDAYATGVYVAYQNSETAKKLGLETPNEPPTVENCPACGKPINKRVIILELIK